jgi:acetyl-CoA carboxylase biotin carboxyl carrier protein
MNIDIRKIRQLIKLLDEGVSEIEIREGEQAVRITRAAQPSSIQYIAPPPPVAAPPQYAPPSHTESPKEQENEQEAVSSKGHQINAPMVGTVYFSSAPEDPPFITIGQKVQKGDTLCLIEAMKMFNEIEADIAGTVTRAFVENGQSVEYAQPLFVIEE